MSSSIQLHGFLHQSKNLDRSYILHTPSSKENAEKILLTNINTFILKKCGGPITLKIGKFTLRNIYGANKVAGTAKADIAFVSYDVLTKKFTEQFYLSHKDGSNANSFQQYGGISARSDADNPGVISKHPEVVSFLEAISIRSEEIVKDNSRSRFFRYVNSNDLIEKSVFGADFRDKYGKNAIHAIAQGNVHFAKRGVNFYELTFSAKLKFNDDISTFTQGDYKAILFARYEDKSSFKFQEKTYKKIRVIITPKILAGNTGIEI